MKILFERQKLIDTVSPMMCAVSNKSTLPEVEGILIDASNESKCILTSFDLEKGIRMEVEAEVLEPGKAIINAQKLLQTLRVMDGKDITLTVSDTLQACIQSGKSSHKLTALSDDLYPSIPELVTNEGFIVNQALLKRMFEKISFAMGINDKRPILNGCYLKVNQEEILAVACDSFKIAKCSVNSVLEKVENQENDIDYNIIVPNKTVIEICKILKDDEREDVKIYITKKNIIFHTGKMIFFSRLIEGQYIDYDRVIVKTHRIFIGINREELISALERAALITEEKAPGSVRSHVKLAFEGDIVKVSAISSAGSTYDELNIEHEGEDISIAFNNRFLIDTLKSLDADFVKLSITSSLMGMNVEPKDSKEGTQEIYMILPVKMKE